MQFTQLYRKYNTFYACICLLKYLSSLSRYGRKPILFAALALQTVFTFAQVFSGSWIMFLIILFINGLGQMSNFVAALVLGRIEHLFSYDAKLRARFIRVSWSCVSDPVFLSFVLLVFDFLLTLAPQPFSIS